MLILAGTPVHAQEQDDSQAREPTQLDTVTVTGSRIPRVDYLSASPVGTLTAEDIKATGAVSLGDVVNALPQMSTTFSMGNSTRFIGTAGLNLLDLRGLGTDRTLVLVNGRRHVGGSVGSSAVDINTIPAALVERVEILTGGSSAIYGADAVSGVVNFILKKSFEGTVLNAQIGQSEEGGFNERAFSVTSGADFADGRGQFVMSAGFNSQDPLYLRDRDFSRDSQRYLTDPNDPTNARTILTRGASVYTYTSGGVFDVDRNGKTVNDRYVFDPDGRFRPQRFDGLVDTVRSGCTDCDSLDPNQYGQMQPSNRTGSLNVNLGFDLNDNHRIFVESKLVQSKIKAFSTSGPSFGTYSISRDNAYISDELGEFMDENGLPNLRINRNNTDAGFRGEDITRKTGRIVAGISGIFGTDWSYEASANYGRTSESRANLNNLIPDRFNASIDAVFDAGGNIVCRSVRDGIAGPVDPVTGEDLLAGCVPTSIFGEGAVSPEAAAWFNTRTPSRTELTQKVFSATLAKTELFAMPAGSVGLASGIEFRKETSQQTTDPLQQADLTFLNAIQNQRGEYSVREAFAEINVPLLADMAFAQNVSLSLAGRVSDYTTVGSTFSWKAGLDWAANDSVRLRGTFSNAVRAPNIAELYDPQSVNFYTISDPCSAQNIRHGADPALRQANCSALGIPVGWTLEDTSTRRGLSGGNPQLSEETSKTFTMGAVLTPTFLPGFGITVDYWDIEIEDAISYITGQQIAEHCVDAVGGIGNEFCANISRDMAGETEHRYAITGLQIIPFNISKLKARGIDFGVDYVWDNVFDGRLTAKLEGTYLKEYLSYPFQSFPDEEVDGRGVLGSSTPTWKGIFTLAYARGPWKASVRTRYVDSQILVTNEQYASNPDMQDPIKVKWKTFTDARVGFDATDRLNVYLGVRNVFDREPPYNLYGTGLGSAQYDNIGRFVYTGVNYRF
ncbi:TonB-dependent receptor [Lysobacter sp. LF1]|uniref:TonB-dependent receptor n=1 Tax=Lysobacter stagni TaxID=3045172 RepID=A0ABT6XIA4_9GAMM|nr:TonB-dependent receptor [Lysobacter sp. LF1]MDI9239891.1 TonB-dependent receptor [Lysobacter sp. LF1]